MNFLILSTIYLIRLKKCYIFIKIVIKNGNGPHLYQNNSLIIKTFNPQNFNFNLSKIINSDNLYGPEVISKHTL
jgi:hypothetical protein